MISLLTVADTTVPTLIDLFFKFSAFKEKTDASALNTLKNPQTGRLAEVARIAALVVILSSLSPIKFLRKLTFAQNSLFSCMEQYVFCCCFG